MCFHVLKFILFLSFLDWLISKGKIGLLWGFDGLLGFIIFVFVEGNVNDVLDRGFLIMIDNNEPLRKRLSSS